MSDDVWSVYMVLCSDNTIYTGISNNVLKRVKKHNSSRGAKYTSTRTPVTCFFTKKIGTMGEALKFERFIKKKTRKEKLSMNNLNVFTLTKDGKLLDPSVQATVLAKYSRSPDSAYDILNSVSVDESSKFYDKWAVTYGHSSVQELAVVPVCFEGVSIIASKHIESFQRPGYSEKSTRYQKFSVNSFINPVPGEVEPINHAIKLYDAYNNITDGLTKKLSKKLNRKESDPILKARVFDNTRYLLPAGTGTSLGTVANTRDLRYMAESLLGSDLAEFNLIGDKLVKTVSDVTPVFMSKVKKKVNNPKVKLGGQLLSHGVKIKRSFGTSDNEFLLEVKNMYDMNESDFSSFMSNRAGHCPDVFKKFDIEFEVVMDYGAYRDMQRHRRCEQTTSLLNRSIGYCVPDDILGSEFENEYRSAMELVPSKSYGEELDQYMIPIGYLHRSNFKMDFAELYYIIELRTKPQGHISYRRIAYEMFLKSNELFPLIMSWCRPTSVTEIGDHM